MPCWKRGLRDLGVVVLSRLISAREHSDRSLLATCCFRLRQKPCLPSWKFRVWCVVRRVCFLSAALVHPWHHPHSTEENRSWKSPISKPAFSYYPQHSSVAFGRSNHILPQRKPEGDTGRSHQQHPGDQHQDLPATCPGPGTAAQGQQLQASPCSAAMQHPGQDSPGVITRVQLSHGCKQAPCTGWGSC